jgi:phenylalanyl-tRNA synthetase beta chain
MRIPLSWLREYVPVSVPTAELAERLTVSTCEVERVSRIGVPDVNGNLGLYRVGRVVDAAKHPNADRLQLCRVDVGEPEPREIVCGAWNFGAGATVPVALPGAILPDGRTLERARLRGTVSDGMILSERELELGLDHTGILVLPDPWEPGTPLADVFPLAEEVLEVETTPNRPDLLSVYGIAREVAALFGLELAPPPGRNPERVGDETPSLEIRDFDGCPRYVGRVFRDVRVAASPPWLKARLVAAGMRPISNVVDVTNYVMVALGNPLHAFDADTLRGGIVVRRADPGEELTTLDGVLRRLDPADLVIADHERGVAFAGVMGGLETEVRAESTTILLEAANFEPVGILRTSERHGLRTEGSNRWEKGVDPHLAPQAAALATELLVSLVGARWTGEAEVAGELPERPVIRLREDRVGVVTGLDVGRDEQDEILVGIGFALDAEGDVITPTWRARDVTREIDLVEEVIRIHGLDKVPSTLPLRRAMFGRVKNDQRLRRLVEDLLVGLGFAEAYTSSLVRDDPHPQALRLPDPLSAEQAVLRTTLVHGLLGAVRRNVDAGNEEVALFEIARVYLPTGETFPEEPRRVGAITHGGFTRAKGAVEVLHAALHLNARFERAANDLAHPGKSARLAGGWVAELHPALMPGGWGAFELDLDELFARVPERRVYEDVITYPAVHQDLAFVVDEDVLAGDLADAARAAAPPPPRPSFVRPASSTSIAAARSRPAASPSRFASRSSRRNERSPTRTRGPSGMGLWRRLLSASAPSSAPKPAISDPKLPIRGVARPRTGYLGSNLSHAEEDPQ